jgi:hypothetical protein
MRRARNRSESRRMQRIPARRVLTGPRTDPTRIKVSTNADVGSRVSEAAHPGSAGSNETC